jgi:hypothetical protein
MDSSVEDFFTLVLWDPNQPPSAFLMGERIAWLKGVRHRQTEIIEAVKARFGSIRGVTRTPGWLVREPQNVHDANAVAVYLGAYCVGYLARELAAVTAPTIDGMARAGLAFAGRPCGHPSCLVQIKPVTDGTLIVGAVGPWPAHVSGAEVPNAPATPPKSEDKAAASTPYVGRREAAVARLRLDMSTDELVEALGERPAKVDAKVTKKGTRETFHFFEHYLREGRFTLKVSALDGKVFEWDYKPED